MTAQSDERNRRVSDHKALTWILKYWPIILLACTLFFGLIAYASATKVRELARTEALGVTMTRSEVESIIAKSPDVIEIKTRMVGFKDALDEANRKLDRLLTRREERQ